MLHPNCSRRALMGCLAAATWSLAQPARATSFLPVMGFALGGGGTIKLATDQPVERPVTYGHLGIGLRSATRVSFSMALTGETFRIDRLHSDGIAPAGMKGRHDGRGVGIELGAEAKRFRAYLQYGGGRMDSEALAPNGKDVDVRYTFRTVGVAIGIMLFESGSGSLDLVLGVKQLRPDLVWQRDFGYRDVMLSYLAFAIKIVDAHPDNL